MPTPCSYLEGQNSSSIFSQNPNIDAQAYQQLSELGFRRSGGQIYRPHCEDCQACEPTRVPLKSFKASKSQRRNLKKNSDIDYSIEPLVNDDEHMELYERYQWHQHRGHMSASATEYLDMFDHPNIPVRHIDFRLNGQLIGVSIVDLMPKAISSVYFYFCPEHRNRGLGTFSALVEFQEALKLGMEHAYLGFTIAACQKMAYKAKFMPQERFLNEEWTASSPNDSIHAN
jgi:arginine-tRNA-protein transferase